MDTKTEKLARQLCTHTVVFTEITDIMIVVRSLQGRSTKAIAQEYGLTEAQVQYRICKAQNSLQARFRADYRNGTGHLVVKMLSATERFARKLVTTEIAPKFIPFARTGVPRAA